MPTYTELGLVPADLQKTGSPRAASEVPTDTEQQLRKKIKDLEHIIVDFKDIIKTTPNLKAYFQNAIKKTKVEIKRYTSALKMYIKLTKI